MINGDAAVGDSILTDGVCLTVTALRRGGFTRRRHGRDSAPHDALGAPRPGDRLNLERALALGYRLGGHIVSGHIDGVGTVTSVTPEDNALVIEIERAGGGGASDSGPGLRGRGRREPHSGVRRRRAPAGVLIPHTAAMTTLGRLRTGSRVNLEADLIAKYVYAFVSGRKPEGRTHLGEAAEAGF